MIAPRKPLIQRPAPPGPSRLAMYRKELSILSLLVLLCAGVGLVNHSFLGVENIQDLARRVGLYGIFSLGLGAVIVTGGIDLSVGSLIALEGVLFADMLTVWHWPWVSAVAASIAITAALGWLHGVLITKLDLQPFIVTLCGLLIYRGLARFVTDDETRGFGDAHGFEGLAALATGSWLGVPAPFWVLIILSVVMWVLMHRTVFGRHLFAVGRNEEAARYSGIATARVITGAYVICGVLVGISGILIGFYTNSISPSSHGTFYELYGIAAAVLGGCSLRGGEGSVPGILIGATLLQVLQNFVNLVGIPSSLNFAVMGIVILAGVIVDELIKRRSARVR
jgi:ribose transport system permease protein